MDSGKFSGKPDLLIKALMDISSAINSDLYLEDILKLIVMVTAKGKKIHLKATQTIDEKKGGRP